MFSGMLSELRATNVVYDSAGDVTHVTIHPPPAGATPHETPASLLLDARGFLVGVDLEPEGAARIVVMLGPHEAVASQRNARVMVLRGAGGEPCEVQISSAGRACRGAEPSPYSH